MIASVWLQVVVGVLQDSLDDSVLMMVTSFATEPVNEPEAVTVAGGAYRLARVGQAVFIHMQEAIAARACRWPDVGGNAPGEGLAVTLVTTVRYGCHRV